MERRGVEVAAALAAVAVGDTKGGWKMRWILFLWNNLK